MAVPVALPPAPPAHVRVLRPEFRGGALRIFKERREEVVIAGPAGTGKTIGVMHKLHAIALKYPGARILILRKRLTDLAASGLVTFETKVLDPADGVKFFGGSAREPASYRYPNKSRIVIGGMDRPTKVLSAEYDIIYVQECTELTKEEWEFLIMRLRSGTVPYQQLLGDCNPDAPTHWIKRRADEGKLVLIPSVHEDNPAYWDAEKQQWTELGAAYMAKLEKLTGVRYLRYRKGIWAAAEGIVYESFSRAVHIRQRPKDWAEKSRNWRRIWCVDFGYRDPFVWQCWAIDHDGRMWLEHEIFRTGRLVEDHAKTILECAGWKWDEVTQSLISTREGSAPLPEVILCDHDAEDRATLARHLHLPTRPAYKLISPGVQAMAARLRVLGNGEPSLVLLEDALYETDPELLESKSPICTADEFECYIWDTSSNRRKGEYPLDKNNHGMDAARYGVAYVDLLSGAVASEWEVF